MSRRGMAAMCMLGLGLVAPAFGQVAEAPKPESYEVRLRYRIRAVQELRIQQFESLAKHLADIGFQHVDAKRFETDLLDPAAESASGMLPLKSRSKLLDDANIKTALLVPAGSKLLDDPKKIVEVRIALASGLGATEQKLLHGQASDRLAKLGFEAAIGYDHRDFTILRGRMSAGEVPLLLKDLRALPQGWFVGEADREALPLPLKNLLPIRTIEVLSDRPIVALPPNPVDSGGLTADLAAYLADAANAEKPLVVEAVLERDFSADAIAARRRIAAALTGITVEGIAGNVATLRLAKASLLPKVTAYTEVQAVRLPRPGHETISASAVAATTDFLESSNIKLLHALGHTGQGKRIVVLATGFPGLKIEGVPKTAKEGTLPKLQLEVLDLPEGSRFLDLTAELGPKIEPAPMDALRTGGTAAALAAHLAAPGAAILLVRLDPSRFHQMLAVAKIIGGEATGSPALYTRNEELSVAGSAIESRRKAVSAELDRAFSDLSDDDRQKKRRDDAAAAYKQFKIDDAAHLAALQRFLAVREGLDALRGANVVVSTLYWDEGYPLDGQSELSKLIESKFAVGFHAKVDRNTGRPSDTPTWIQPASSAVGSTWTGPFLDADLNGAMEFATADTPIPAKAWSREFNAIGYAPSGGKPGAMLPAGAKVRIAIQWREPHDPDLIAPLRAEYDLRLRVFRQIDPAGKTYDSDELVEVARSRGEALRVHSTRSSGSYEQIVEFAAPVEGVYLLRVEGGLAELAVPRSSKAKSEIRPRLLVELTDPAQEAKGSVTFASYSSKAGGVGIPGDAAAAVTIAEQGAVTLTGAGPGVALAAKPDLVAEGAISMGGKTQRGAGVAAGYAAGVAACLSNVDVRASDLIRSLGLKAGDPLVLPAEWLNSLSPKRPTSER